MNNDRISKSIPPHVHTWQTARKSIWIAVLTLIPVIAWSIVLFGLPAIYIWGSTIFTALITDGISSLVMHKKFYVSDASVLTGILIAAAMPATVPLYIPILASIFAILVVRQFFGGVGSNWMNPAMAGIAFAYVNWPQSMLPQLNPLNWQLDTLTGASPMAAIQEGFNAYYNTSPSIMSGLISGADQAVTSFLNIWIFNPLHAKLPEGYVNFLLGLNANTLGEAGLLFIILGSIVLISLNLVKIEIPAALFIMYLVLVKIFGLGISDLPTVDTNILTSLTMGGFLLCTFYYATDPVSSPVTRAGMIFYGILVAFLFYIFSRHRAFIEGGAFAVIIANIFVSSIDKLVIRIKILLRSKSA